MPQVAVIGGGVAGLTAAILLEKEGIETAVFEKHSNSGGNLTAWKREGYTVDNCMHWLNGTRKGSALHALFTEIGLLGDEVPIKRLPFFYRSVSQTNGVTFYRNPARTRREMLALSPADRQETDRFYRAVTAAAVFLSQKEEHGLLKKLRRAPALLPYLRLSLRELSERFRHPLLRHAFTDYIGGEFSSLALILAYAAFLRGDADLPAGGSGAAADRIAARYTALGGSLHTECEVTSVTTDRGRITEITLQDGQTLTADAFVFAADPAVSFGRLLPPESMPKRLRALYRKRETYPIFSAFQVAWSADTDRLPFSGCTAIPAPPFLSGGRLEKRLMLRSFSHESEFAPSGKSVLQGWVLQREPAAREWLSLYSDPDAYRERKELLAARMTDAVTAFYPSLADRIRIIDTWTPATYHRYTGGMYGAFLSFAVTEKAIPIPEKSRLEGLKNGFLATQWQSPPGGLPGAAQNGKAAATAVIKYLNKDRDR